jgi:hypothetical protein
MPHHFEDKRHQARAIFTMTLSSNISGGHVKQRHCHTLFNIYLWPICDDNKWFFASGFVPANYVQSETLEFSPLHEACRRGNVQLLEECLQNRSVPAVGSYTIKFKLCCCSARKFKICDIFLVTPRAANGPNDILKLRDALAMKSLLKSTSHTQDMAPLSVMIAGSLQEYLCTPLSILIDVGCISWAFFYS